jgi:hypothetical protein
MGRRSTQISRFFNRRLSAAEPWCSFRSLLGGDGWPSGQHPALPVQRRMGRQRSCQAAPVPILGLCKRSKSAAGAMAHPRLAANRAWSPTLSKAPPIFGSKQDQTPASNRVCAAGHNGARNRSNLPIRVYTKRSAAATDSSRHDTSRFRGGNIADTPCGGIDSCSA